MENAAAVVLVRQGDDAGQPTSKGWCREKKGAPGDQPKGNTPESTLSGRGTLGPLWTWVKISEKKPSVPAVTGPMEKGTCAPRSCGERGSTGSVVPSTKVCRLWGLKRGGGVR